MPLLVPDVGEMLAVERILTTANETLKLYVSNTTPAEADTAASYTEMTTHGYVAKTLTAASWTVATSAGVTTGSYATQTWTFTAAAAVTVYGYFVIDATIPAAPTATDSGVAGNVNVGAHSWKVTFISVGGNETIAGTKSNVVTIVTTAKQVNLTAIPTGSAGTINRKIYRTVAGDTGDYKLVGTITDNTTTIYTDNIADASLGAVAPIAGTLMWAERFTDPQVIANAGDEIKVTPKFEGA